MNVAVNMSSSPMKEGRMKQVKVEWYHNKESWIRFADCRPPVPASDTYFN